MPKGLFDIPPLFLQEVATSPWFEETGLLERIANKPNTGMSVKEAQYIDDQKRELVEALDRLFITYLASEVKRVSIHPTDGEKKYPTANLLQLDDNCSATFTFPVTRGNEMAQATFEQQPDGNYRVAFPLTGSIELETMPDIQRAGLLLAVDILSHLMTANETRDQFESKALP